MSEEIDFEIGHFRDFDMPVTLTLTSDDIESHMGVCSWEEIFFTVEDIIRSLPSLSVIDFTAVWTWKMQSGPILKSHKRARDGRYRQFSVCLWEEDLLSIEYTIYFVHDSLLFILFMTLCYWFWAMSEFSGNASWAILKSQNGKTKAKVINSAS